MIPSLLAAQIHTGLDAYLHNTFSLANGPFKTMLETWIASGKGIQGPYFSLGLPFRPGQSQTWFAELPPDYPPHRHQELAYARLAPLSGPRRSTIVATGTGSGKTECFLYPIYAHCLREHKRQSKGIKAICIYPMNALATDQADRIAKFIAKRPHMKGIRAGLYIGGKEKESQPVMTKDRVITDREVMREDPPDILITNYKMLDLLLQRVEDKPLWRFNTPETLRYLVVDELHTFDGAQGTDLACLLRRLKDRLQVPQGSLCCVGTSATLGSGPEALQALLKYAQEIFGEALDEDAVIREDRLSPQEFLGQEPDFVYSDTPWNLETLLPEPMESQNAYLCRQYRAWFGEEATPEDFSDTAFLVALGYKLKAHSQFRNAVRRMGADVVPAKTLAERLFRTNDERAQARINSLMALISAARAENARQGIIPLVHVRVQLWIRELTNVLASVGAQPELFLQDDVDAGHQELCLPVLYCRECGLAGWASTTDINGTEVRNDVKGFYRNFFGKAPAYDFFFPQMGREQAGDKGTVEQLCPQCRRLALHTKEGRCSHCGAEGTVGPVAVLHMRSVDAAHCPCCGASSPWLILGSRSASLTSAVISLLTASRLNSDKKNHRLFGQRPGCRPQGRFLRGTHLRPDHAGRDTAMPASHAGKTAPGRLCRML